MSPLNLTRCPGASQSCSMIAAALMFVGAFAGTPARAGTDPTLFVGSLGGQLQMVAAQPSPLQRQPGFRRLFEEDFDVPGISRFVLGRFSRVLTPSEQQQFVCYFEDYVVLSFSDRLSQFVADGAVFKVTGSRLGADGVIVYSQISRGSGQAMRVDWHLIPFASVYKVSDIVIDGVSMTLSGRSDIEGVVQRNGGQAQSILPVMRQETTSSSSRGVPDRCRSVGIEHVRAAF